MSLGDRSFVELLIRHLLTASSWKRRVLFPGVALPRTTGRRQEAFHSATKVRWMTTLSYWDTREETALEGIKTGKVGCSHVHLYVHFPFSCPSLLPSFSIIPRSFFCVCISPLRCVFFPPSVCLYFLVVTLKTLTTQKQTLKIFSDISWAYHCMIWACFWKPGNSFFQVRLNLRFIGCSDNGAVRSDHGWINCSPQPIGRSDEFLTSPKLWSPQLEQSWRIDSLRSVPFFFSPASKSAMKTWRAMSRWLLHLSRLIWPRQGIKPWTDPCLRVHVCEREKQRVIWALQMRPRYYRSILHSDKWRWLFYFLFYMYSVWSFGLTSQAIYSHSTSRN